MPVHVALEHQHLRPKQMHVALYMDQYSVTAQSVSHLEGFCFSILSPGRNHVDGTVSCNYYGDVYVGSYLQTLNKS